MKIKVFIEHGGLKKNHELSGMSLEELAGKTGIDPHNIRQYEEETLDLNQAPLISLMKLCFALDCDLPILLTETETLKAYRKYMSKYSEGFVDDEDETEDEDDAAQIPISETIEKLKRLSETMKEKPGIDPITNNNKMGTILKETVPGSNSR